MKDEFVNYPNQFAGELGTLYHGTRYGVNVPTTYNDEKDVWVTAYLPFVGESNSNIPIELFGSNYTTAIAVCSEKAPLEGLTTPIQVASYDYVGPTSELKKMALTAIVPYGQNASDHGEHIESWTRLNWEKAYDKMLPGSYGMSVLAAAQNYLKFANQVLVDKDGIPWQGIEKDGSKMIKFLIVPSQVPNHSTGPVFSVFGLEEIRICNNTLDILGFDASQAVVGREIARSILINKFGQPTGHFRELAEGFSKIVGHSSRLWGKLQKFDDIDWDFYREQTPTGMNAIQLMNDPKSYQRPIAYQGEFYDVDPNVQTYNPEKNGSILEYLLFLVAQGKSGFVDGNSSNEPFDVKQLFPGDKNTSYSIAVRIIFNAFMTKLNNQADYPALMKATLETAVEMGYPVGSHQYMQLVKAWHAVGVGPFNLNCAQTASGLSSFNGNLTFNIRETTPSPNPTGPKIRELLNCSEASTIGVRDGDYNYITDWNDDEIFSNTNDATESKIAVSLHTFGGLAKDWYKKNFGHNGYHVEYILKNSPNQSVKYIFENNLATIYAPMEAKEALRDQISKRYFGVVSHHLKEAANPGQGQSADHQVIAAALSNIFALEIKREYELGKGNSNAHDLWTINEEASDPNLFHNFANPKSSQQPALNGGVNWNATNSDRNTGFLNLFYYLLTHGTADELGQDIGYTNVELPGKVYFINKMKKDLVLKVLWEAYRSVSLNASIEEFRQATMTTLHSDPLTDPKSKEHIAFYDAWAAVLGLPDYASTLKHFPEDDAIVYPWAAKVGVEVEYPLYESYRLFEVSKSSTFNESEYPVHRFMNGSAPDLESGMTYGYINLEPGQKYYVRSHLAEGPDSRALCGNSPDPAFCESLLGKKKWTLVYPFTTETVPAPVTLVPGAGQEVPAWSTPFEWQGVKGSLGYDLLVMDPMVTGKEHNIAVDIAYDADQIDLPVKTTLALSKGKPYSYKMAARQKLGSEQAVHVLPGGMLQLLTEAEKEQFPNTYGKWNEEVSFTTDIPRIKLHSPADGAHVPIFGKDTTVRAKKEFPQRADYYQYSFREPFYTDKALEVDSSFAHYPITIQGLIGLEDKKSYEWTFIQRKKKTLPFIPVEEEGASPGWFTFIVDKDLVPAPEVENIDCVQSGSQVVLHWKEVPGAQSYRYSITNVTTQTDYPPLQTGYLGATINGVSEYPNKYVYKVEAGVMGSNGKWIFGKEAVGDYSVNPPNPTNFTPPGPTIALGANNSIHFGWDDPSQSGQFHFELTKNDNQTNTTEEIVDTEFSGAGILVEDLEHNTEYTREVQVIGANGCNSTPVSSSFMTDREPVKPELEFGLGIASIVAFGLPGPPVTYSVAIHDPNGVTVFSAIGMTSNVSTPGGKLPILDGTYTVDILITDADPAYLLEEGLEGVINFWTELWDIAADVQMDFDEQAGLFDPAKNLKIKFGFTVDTATHTISH